MTEYKFKFGDKVRLKSTDSLPEGMPLSMGEAALSSAGVMGVVLDECDTPDIRFSDGVVLTLCQDKLVLVEASETRQPGKFDKPEESVHQAVDTGNESRKDFHLSPTTWTMCKKDIFEETATTFTLDDECGGLFIVVKQLVDETSEIKLDFNEVDRFIEALQKVKEAGIALQEKLS